MIPGRCRVFALLFNIIVIVVITGKRWFCYYCVSQLVNIDCSDNIEVLFFFVLCYLLGCPVDCVKMLFIIILCKKLGCYGNCKKVLYLSQVTSKTLLPHCDFVEHQVAEAVCIVKFKPSLRQRWRINYFNTYCHNTTLTW